MRRITLNSVIITASGTAQAQIIAKIQTANDFVLELQTVLET